MAKITKTQAEAAYGIYSSKIEYARKSYVDSNIESFKTNPNNKNIITAINNYYNAKVAVDNATELLHELNSKLSDFKKALITLSGVKVFDSNSPDHIIRSILMDKVKIPQMEYTYFVNSMLILKDDDIKNTLEQEVAKVLNAITCDYIDTKVKDAKKSSKKSKS